MKMITWVKPYLINFNRLIALLTLSLTLGVCAYAKVETSSLFVHLSDAMQAVKQGEPNQSQPYLTAFQQEFEAIPSHNSDAGQRVKISLNFAKSDPTLAHFEQLAKAVKDSNKCQKIQINVTTTIKLFYVKHYINTVD